MAQPPLEMRDRSSNDARQTARPPCDRRRFLQSAGSLLAGTALASCSNLGSPARRSGTPPIGMNVLLWTDHLEPKHFPIFDKLAAAGYAGAEIPIGRGNAAHFRAIRGAMKAAGLRCTAVTAPPPEADPISPEPSVRAAAKDRMHWVVDMCAELEAETLCGPFHSAFKNFAGRGPTPAEFGYSAEVMANAADYAADQGLVLAAEFLNRFECYLVNTAADTLRLVRMVDKPNFGMTYDTHHAHIEVQDAAAAIKSCGNAIRHVHVSENDRGTPGAGQVRFDETFTALHEIGYDSWLTIESFSRQSPEFAAAIHVWRDFFDHPDDVWQEGIRFIRKTWNATR